MDRALAVEHILREWRGWMAAKAKPQLIDNELADEIRDLLVQAWDEGYGVGEEDGKQHAASIGEAGA